MEPSDHVRSFIGQAARFIPAMAAGVTDRLWEIVDNGKILKYWEEAISVGPRWSWMWTSRNFRI
jgi:hypothetical protein